MSALFTKSVMASRVGMIHYLEGKDANGLPAFFFIMPGAGKDQALPLALSAGSVDLTQYGHILHSGFGYLSEQEREEWFANWQIDPSTSMN